MSKKKKTMESGKKAGLVADDFPVDNNETRKSKGKENESKKQSRGK
jgi:hypothetical protein